MKVQRPIGGRELREELKSSNWKHPRPAFVVDVFFVWMTTITRDVQTQSLTMDV